MLPCNESEENVDHIILHCVMTRLLWELLLSLFGDTWVNPELVWDTLASWEGSLVGKKCK